MINYLFVAIASAIASFLLFAHLYKRAGSPWLRAILMVISLVLTIPAVLFSSYYLLHKPSQCWFYYFHSLPGIEASSGLVGAPLGVLFANYRLRPNWLKLFSLTIPATISSLLLIAPFYKPLFFKMDYSQLQDRWKDGVCIQTSGTTCVPASCATVIRTLGGHISERDLASEAGTTGRGTEIWYMMRALPKHGYRMEARTAASVKDMTSPAVIGLKNGGHVVVLLSNGAAGPEIGNPLGSRRKYTWDVFQRVYDIEPVYFATKPIGGRK